MPRSFPGAPDDGPVAVSSIERGPFPSSCQNPLSCSDEDLGITGRHSATRGTDGAGAFRSGRRRALPGRVVFLAISTSPVKAESTPAFLLARVSPLAAAWLRLSDSGSPRLGRRWGMVTASRVRRLRFHHAHVLLRACSCSGVAATIRLDRFDATARRDPARGVRALRAEQERPLRARGSRICFLGCGVDADPLDELVSCPRGSRAGSAL
jgi:hypothetical protein